MMVPLITPIIVLGLCQGEPVSTDCLAQLTVAPCPQIDCPEYMEGLSPQFVPLSNCLHLTRPFTMAFIQSTCIDSSHRTQPVGNCLNIRRGLGMGHHVSIYSSSNGVALSSVLMGRYNESLPYSNAPPTGAQCDRIIPIHRGMELQIEYSDVTQLFANPVDFYALDHSSLRPPPPPPNMLRRALLLQPRGGGGECRLDFLTDGSKMESDGNLVAELSWMELMHRDSVLTDSTSMFACFVQNTPAFGCLDIGAPTTGGSTLFGQSDPCGQDGPIGDGLINVFDIATALSWLFDETAYAAMPRAEESVVTVTERPGMDAVCTAAMSRHDYMRAYASNSCFIPSVPPLRRRAMRATTASEAWSQFGSEASALQQVDSSPPPPPAVELTPFGTSLHQQMVLLLHEDVTSASSGSWYSLHFNFIATRIEVVFTGLYGMEAPLSRRAFDGAPLGEDDAPRGQVRYTCREDYPIPCVCGGIHTVGYWALLHRTLSLIQQEQPQPTELLPLCPHDVHIWIPHPLRDEAPCLSIDYLITGQQDFFMEGRGECALSRHAQESEQTPAAWHGALIAIGATAGFLCLVFAVACARLGRQPQISSKTKKAGAAVTK